MVLPVAPDEAVARIVFGVSKPWNRPYVSYSFTNSTGSLGICGAADGAFVGDNFSGDWTTEEGDWRNEKLGSILLESEFVLRRLLVGVLKECEGSSEIFFCIFGKIYC